MPRRDVRRILLDNALAQPKKLRVAFYIRVSRKTEDQMHSFEAQKAACDLTLAQHPEYALVKLYADPGITGTLAERRPGFMEMIADAEAGKIDLVITKSISRWSRNTVECLSYVNALLAAGANVVFEKENIDTREAYSVLALHIFAVLSQEESRSISENTKYGIRWDFELGYARWCPIYGYARGKAEYEVVPHEKAVVQRIFREYEAGSSIQQITRALNASGIPTPRGGQWRMCRVHSILKNRKYAGDLVMQKYYTKDHITHAAVKNDGSTVPIYIVPDHHEPIVDREQFERVQRILAMRNMSGGRGNQYPFGDMLRCPRCGAALHQRSIQSRGRRMRVWSCEAGCGFAIDTRAVEGAVMAAYEALDMRKLSHDRSAAALELWEMKRQRPRLDSVEYLFLDKLVEGIELGGHATPADSAILIRWRFGHTSIIQTDETEAATIQAIQVRG